MHSFVISPDDERGTAKALTKAMAVFGGGKTAQEWPPFLASPHVTTHDNAANSNCLYIILPSKWGPLQWNPS